MYKMFKLAFKLGYRFAERHYYHRLIERSKYRDMYELQMMDTDSNVSKERLKKQIDFETRFATIVDSVFSSVDTTREYQTAENPFDSDINNEL